MTAVTTPNPPARDGLARSLLTDDLLREVRRLRVRARRRVDNLLSGEYHSAFRGRGIEFAEVREYQPGDDVRAIDWNVTARAGGNERAFVKQFVEERQLTVMLVVDQSGSGRFGTVRSTKARLAVEIAAVLALAATRNNDRVGLAIFSDGIDFYTPPARGRGQAVRVMTDLLTHVPQASGTDLGGALRFVGRVLTRRAVVFIVSDFLAEDYGVPLRLLSARHEVIAVTMTDPRESRLPAGGLVDFEDAETGERVVTDLNDPRERVRFERAAEQRRIELDRSLASAGIDRIPVSTDRPFVQDLARYFQLRERRR